MSQIYKILFFTLIFSTISNNYIRAENNSCSLDAIKLNRLIKVDYLLDGGSIAYNLELVDSRKIWLILKYNKSKKHENQKIYLSEKLQFVETELIETNSKIETIILSQIQKLLDIKNDDSLIHLRKKIIERRKFSSNIKNGNY